jgi:hypothetical protein
MNMHTSILIADKGNIYDLLEQFTNYCDDISKPTAKFEYFGISERIEDALPLKQPRKLRIFFGLLPAGKTTRAFVAKKSEIDQEAFLSDPPPAMFFRGHLYECSVNADRAAAAKWQEDFRKRFSEIPDDTLLRIVDAHS